MNKEKEIMESLWNHFKIDINGMTGDDNDMVISLRNGKTITINNYLNKEIETIINEITQKNNK